MNKNKDDVLIELQELKRKNEKIYLFSIRENQYSNIDLIENNCIKNQCPNYGTIEFDNITWHLCNDNWSGLEFAPGWHPIYCETLDLCVERYLNR